MFVAAHFARGHGAMIAPALLVFRPFADDAERGIVLVHAELLGVGASGHAARCRFAALQ
jgi:hypothetical protein